MLAPAGDGDVDEVVALVNLAYRGTTGWSTEAGYLDGDRTTAGLLREDLRSHPDAQVLVWRATSRRLLATVWLEPLEDGVWYLGSLAVDPEQQNGGLGRRTLGAAEEWARERGATTIRISVVNVREPLIAWYERRGFRRTGEVRPFPYGDDRFGRPLRADLGFVVLEKAVDPGARVSSWRP